MKRQGLSQITIVILVVAVLVISVALLFVSQALVESDAFAIDVPGGISARDRYEIAKLAAEVRQIRSDTGGSLFWLKMIGLFVTVGGAVGGYLIGQSHSTRSRIAFEDRKNVDAVYGSMVAELSDPAPLLRAAAAVKLGTLLNSFPAEWNVSPSRREQLVDLTKKVLAAALAIEKDSKVLKALTIAVAMHRPWSDDDRDPVRKELSDLRGLDMSGVSAADAYWARADCTDADFYRAELTRCSLRRAILDRAQFREADLQGAVLAGARCEGTNFKMADLRGADLTAARLVGARFDDAKVSGAVLSGATAGNNPDGQVDASPAGDGSMLIPLGEWLGSATASEKA